MANYGTSKSMTPGQAMDRIARAYGSVVSAIEDIEAIGKANATYGETVYGDAVKELADAWKSLEKARGNLNRAWGVMKA